MANIQQMAAPNPILDQNQAYIMAQLKAQRAAQLADMMTNEGASPIQYDQRGAISPYQGLAKMLQAYTGGKMSADSMKQQVDARALGAQLMGQAYGMPQTPGASNVAPVPAGPGSAQAIPPDTPQGFTPPADKPQMAPQGLAAALQGGVQPGNATAMNPYGAPPALVMMAAQGDPAAKAQLETFLKNQEQTPEIKNSRDPNIGGMVMNNLTTQNMSEIARLQLARKLVPDGSPQAQQLDDAISKANYIAPVDAKPGSPVLDPRTMQPKFFAPKTADGINLDFSNPLSPTAAAIPGYAGANAQIQGAEQAAKQANTVFTGVQGPNGAPVAGYGNALFGGQGAAQSPQQQGAQWTGGQLSPQNMQALQAAAQAGNPDAQAALAAYQRSEQGQAKPGVIAGADPTLQTARTNQQNNMAEKWKPLNDAVSNAQTVNSRLDTIKDLANKANTGQFADRMQFVNSLLSFAGSEKATDAVTAKTLLDKNANQIVAQLGQGGLATDAARAIVGAAYPNSHMPKEAIAEASDNLKAANQMQIAKAKVLQPHYLSNNPEAYQQAESQFNAAADPRIFQWKSMASNPAAQAAYAKKLMAQDPSIVERIHTLDQIGALK